MRTRYPSTDPRPVSRSVFDIPMASRRPLWLSAAIGVLRLVVVAAPVAMIALLYVGAHVHHH